ncbi:TM2 domain-containing protein 1-like [Watersipora subatra]|uniref:TM2 domain-containing protein 1-like n=1 Tax=Watersipora subatra TaxID=2589382 RepID=UPI00355BDFE3
MIFIAAMTKAWQLLICTAAIFIPGFCRDCQDLRLGQYRCEDERTTNTVGNFVESCEVLDKNRPEEYAWRILCYPAPGISCNDKVFDGETVGFNYTVTCNKKSEKSLETALLLSIFLGMFGVDRFYLGYPAIGLLKLSTFGFMLVGQLVDIILIATQVVKPADGGDYTVDYFGARMYHSPDNLSFPVP